MVQGAAVYTLILKDMLRYCATPRGVAVDLFNDTHSVIVGPFVLGSTKIKRKSHEWMVDLTDFLKFESTLALLFLVFKK